MRVGALLCNGLTVLVVFFEQLRLRACEAVEFHEKIRWESRLEGPQEIGVTCTPTLAGFRSLRGPKG